ncbi:hypothetical protein ACCO45_002578 [Purpureocillium lilacinum]|uniref:Uncharacterized protein n=1 Tax=Purpureocillium lilacinum TaxID=33203 RepID=A0ACC4EBG8_PURLI
MKYGLPFVVLALCGSAAATGSRHPGFCDLSTGSCWHPRTELTAEEEARFADRLCNAKHPCSCNGGGCFKRAADWQYDKPMFVCD